MTLARRILMVSIVLVALVPYGIWAIGAALLWVFRNGLFGTNPPDVVAANTRLAAVLAVIALFNLVAIVAFLLKSSGYGWWLLVAIQIADAVSLALWLILAKFSDIASIFLLSFGAASGLVASLLLLAFRFWPRRSPVRAASS